MQNNLTNTGNVTRFIRLPEVLSMIGLSRTRVYELIEEGHFPPQVKLSSRAVAWPQDQIMEWMNQRIAATR